MSDRSAWVVHMDERPSVERVGGKAAGLFRLLDLGLSVPRFAVLTADAFHACCDSGIPTQEPTALGGPLDEVWSMLGAGRHPLAVRSSAVDEDGTERSWAGQMETSLNVADRAALGQAVLTSWRSLFSERATKYRELSGGSHAAVAMAVVIQEMVEPDASGVLFTIDPVKGDRDKLLVSAVLGLGEGLVSGALDADTYLLDASGTTLERTLADKRERLVSTAGGGVARIEVPQEAAAAPALTPAVLASLARSSRAAADAAGVPLDIEFAVRQGEVFYLQARPVTAAATHRAPDGTRLVWDNSNIVESYPGITLPLTFSFIRRAYHAVYWQFCELLGLGEDEIRANDHMLANMLGLHRGQVYYNLRNWYRLVSILPGFRQNRRFMEGMMGVTEEGGDPDVDTVSRRRGYLSLVWTGIRAAWLQLTLERRVREFHSTFDRTHAEFSAIPYEELEPAAVMVEYRRVEQALLWRWKAPIVNDFSVMIFYGLLEKLTMRWGIDPEGNLHNVLVSRQGGIESTEVSERLEELAEEIGEDEATSQRFLAVPPSEAIEVLRSHATLGPSLERYLARFGDRCVAELKLESQTMRDDPTPLVAALQASLRRGKRPEAADDGIAKEVEARIDERLNPLRRVLYRWVLRRAKRGIRNRENQRLARTRAFALVRRMARAVAARFVQSGLLDREEDVFYLELDEMMQLCDGTATLLDPRPLVEARRREYAAFRSEPPLPDRFVTHGTAAVAERIAEDGVEAISEDTLAGLGAYPGILEREAMVLLEPDPAAGLDGHVLVTRQTDPGWVIVFPSISALVVERGSMLSHSAIVAREMGIPAVVGVKRATTAIRTGDTVRVDGAAGTVRIVRSAR